MKSINGVDMFSWENGVGVINQFQSLADFGARNVRLPEEYVLNITLEITKKAAERKVRESHQKPCKANLSLRGLLYDLWNPSSPTPSHCTELIRFVRFDMKKGDGMTHSYPLSISKSTYCTRR